MPRPLKEIPRGSVFHEYRGLPRVGPEPVPDLKEGEFWTPPCWSLDHYGDVPEFDPIRSYLSDKQRSANLIDSWYKEDELVITFNHFQLFMLAGIMKEWMFEAFPVTFRFSGIREFHVLGAVGSTQFQMLRHSRDRVFSNLAWINFLRMVEYGDGGVAFVGEFSNKNWLRPADVKLEPFCVHDYFLCVSADRLVLEEGHRDGWVTHMGADQAWIFDDFFAEHKHLPFGNEQYERWLERKKIPYQRQICDKRVWTSS